PNSYLSFNPISYLSLYRGSSLTISDRVHSCVVTLAAGKPALFYPKYISSNDKRPLIFDRAPISINSKNSFYESDLEGIKSELALFKEWLYETITINGKYSEEEKSAANIQITC
ncbi:MAG: polysaccharide pyruvyl transferase family protein, partial [Cyanobacteria bacterium J06649_11]